MGFESRGLRPEMKDTEMKRARSLSNVKSWLKFYFGNWHLPCKRKAGRKDLSGNPTLPEVPYQFNDCLK